MNRAEAGPADGGALPDDAASGRGGRGAEDAHPVVGEPASPGGIARGLLAWFDARDRDVPWRGERDPYRIWVAEVMAQQTRIETVRPYYRDFVARFPDVDALAAARLDDVLHAWQGLGYYARARHLHAAARVVAERHEGVLPDTVEGLRALPGVGTYTAGAIASLAFGLAEPAVDGNARRVLSRLFDLAAPGPARLDEAARRVLAAAPGRAAAVNQALMDLGGAVCAPRAPVCERCPVAGACLARARGTVEQRPPRRRSGPPPGRIAAAAFLARGDRVLLVRRPPEGLLGGLWDLPATTPTAADDRGVPDAELRGALAAALRDDLSIRARVGARIETVDHAFSHFRLRLEVFAAAWEAGVPDDGPERAWIGPGELDRYATPTYLRVVRPRFERLGAPDG